ncbi:hypothetical protein DO97_20955 [Neosynechococcus sphagnicola sy1]|uniref:Gas vesicle protein n=1 Tax=Neosynechococcus sphagnicola sy1 TaxID=1497020 RepID=A0A098TLW3_9CYAN|nr:GvpL/GvpF family gas vesicle protein [Neosynechococcus sphagnicola]KGF73299.1 hypothetical protein DO97_20955 [Neosynechococcus sphagnicola sy1]
MYTYAFCHTPTTPLRFPAGFANPVALISQGEIAAVVEPALFPDGLPEEDQQLIQAVVSHDRVLRELFAQIPLLPLRFGTRFGSCEALLSYLDSHRQDYLEKLASVAGKAEYILKLIPQPFAPAPPSAPEVGQGREYFLAKKQRYQTQLAQQQQQIEERQAVIAAIAQFYPDLRAGEVQDQGERFYLLIDLALEPTLDQQLQVWQTLSPHWQLQRSEALPPYHFV